MPGAQSLPRLSQLRTGVLRKAGHHCDEDQVLELGFRERPLPAAVTISRALLPAKRHASAAAKRPTGSALFWS
jgi:hypothetical protein